METMEGNPLRVGIEGRTGAGLPRGDLAAQDRELSNQMHLTNIPMLLEHIGAGGRAESSELTNPSGRRRTTS